MKIFKSKYREAAIYFSGFLALALIGIVSAAITRGTVVTGFLMILVTLPFCILTGAIFDTLGYIAWYDRFIDSGDYLLYGLFVVLSLLPAALLNTLIIYLITKSSAKTPR